MSTKATAIHEGEADRQQRLAEEYEAGLNVLLHDAQTLPAIPDDVYKFGEVIEHVKNMLASMSHYIGSLKEQAAALKEQHARSVRGDKATLNEKDKQEVARLCSEDLALRGVERRINELTDAWTRWDARRSRLNRDFEVAKIDYEATRRIAAVEVERRMRKDAAEEDRRCRYQAADYEANRRRQSS